MTWARDYSCDNIRCKNYKVKIDADTENHFCESCAAQVQKLGLCLSCGQNNATADASILFPWLCGECEAAAKEVFFNEPLTAIQNRHRPIQQRYEPITRRLPSPVKTFFILMFLYAMIYIVGTNGQLGLFLIIMVALFTIWLPISVISRRKR